MARAIVRESARSFFIWVWHRRDRSTVCAVEAARIGGGSFTTLMLGSKVWAMASQSVEEGIRNYLEMLGEQGKRVVDREAVRALKAQARAEKDVLKKVAVLSELEREQAGRAVDISGPEALFVAEAKGWAEGAGFTVGALQQVGVPDEVLRRAGFTVSQPSRGPVAAGPAGRTSTRAPAIPLDEVAAAARKLGSGWKLADLAEVLDRESMTVRNYVTKLIENGVIVDLGEDPRHDGRGRAPKLYGMG